MNRRSIYQDKETVFSSNKPLKAVSTTCLPVANCCWINVFQQHPTFAMSMAYMYIYIYIYIWITKQNEIRHRTLIKLI